MNLGTQFQVIPLAKAALNFLSGAGCSVLNKSVGQVDAWCDVSVLFHTLQSVS